jgi:hypothetical protein
VTIIFKTRQIADAITKEIAATPNDLVWVWFNPDDSTNDVQYNEGADGRCLVDHPWSEEDRDWLEAYLDGWVQAGTVHLLDAMPADWVSKEVEA